MAKKRSVKREQARTQARTQAALEKKKRRQIVILVTIVVAILMMVELWVFSSGRKVVLETYSDGQQTVELLANGTFRAALAHGQNHSGVYQKTEQGDVTSIAFTSDKITVTGEITGDRLTVPHEWEDDHGHSSGGLLKQ